MKFRFLIIFAFVFSLYSCEEDMQGVELAKPVAEQNTKGLRGGKGSPVDEVLRDLNDLENQLSANTSEALDAAIIWSEVAQARGQFIDTKSFLVDQLNISPELYEKLSAYSPEKSKLLLDESQAVEGAGPITIRYDELTDSGSGDEVFARGCGWRRRASVGLSVLYCATALNELIELIGGAGVQNPIDDCADAVEEVRSYVRECIRGK